MPPAARRSGAPVSSRVELSTPKNTRSPTLTSRSAWLPARRPGPHRRPPRAQLDAGAEARRVGGADPAGAAARTGGAGGIGEGLVRMAAGGQQQQRGSDGDEASDHGLFFRQGGAMEMWPAARGKAGGEQLSKDRGHRVGGHPVRAAVGDQSGSDASVGVETSRSLYPLTSMVNRRLRPDRDCRLNMITRPFGAQVGLSSRNAAGQQPLAAAVRPHHADAEHAALDHHERDQVAARRPGRAAVAALAEADPRWRCRRRALMT